MLTIKFGHRPRFPFLLSTRCLRAASSRPASRNFQSNVLGLLCAVGICLAGCSPSGPAAFKRGQERLTKGDPAGALVQFRLAANLLSSNAVAWQYVGVAAHQSGQFTEAERAYNRALTLDRDLLEARYSLGCLLVEQNRNNEAKPHLIAYNLRRGPNLEGLLKLGTAQIRSQEVTAAERSFTEALRLQPQNAEALNGMGLARLARGRPVEAAQYFSAALRHVPGFSPALLNLAVVRHQHLKDKASALALYRQYATMKPAPANISAVQLIITELEQDLAPRQLPPTNVIAQVQADSPQTSAPAYTSAAPPRSEITLTTTAPVARNIAPPRLATNQTGGRQATVTRDPKPAITSNVVPVDPPRTETVRLPTEPVIKPAQDSVPAKRVPEPEARPVSSEMVAIEPPPPAGTKSKQGRGFFQKINPLNLFQGDEKPKVRPIAQPAPPPGETVTSNTLAGEAPKPSRPPLLRYAYKAPPAPVRGDRVAAQLEFAKGVQAQSARKFAEAAEIYRRATSLDPSLFEGHYNLGLVYTAMGNTNTALAAYETALAIQPGSLDARFNFGLTLSHAGYVQDAVRELTRVLESFPNETRAHLVLGNLQAQYFQDIPRARQHYLKVVELEPRHPQASAIRYWLAAHPL